MPVSGSARGRDLGRSVGISLAETKEHAGIHVARVRPTLVREVIGYPRARSWLVPREAPVRARPLVTLPTAVEQRTSGVIRARSRTQADRALERNA
jgi:hypothetical protein